MSITRKLMLLAALLLLPSLGDAQGRPRAGRPATSGSAADASSNTVTFVLVESLGGDGTGAIIVRRAAHRPQNVVLVTRATTAADVVTAIAMLDRSRRAKGDSLALEMRAVVPRANDAMARRSRNYEQAVTSLARLRVANARPDR